MIGPGVRVAVTGGSGFCGGYVARAAVARGADVVCLGRRPGPDGTRHLPWDAAGGPPDLRGADLILHLAAAVGDPAPERASRAVNVDGARRLLDAADGRPVVWVSSGSVYRPHDGTVTEDHPVDGQRSVYGRTKAAGERLAIEAGAVVLRPRAVYGRGDPHLLPRLRRAVRRGVIRLPGADTRLSLTAVENLADACLRACAWPAGPYNIADARPYPRNETIARVLPGVRVREIPVAVALAAAALRAPGVTRYAVEQLAYGLVLDIGRARAQGWEPARDLGDFLRGAEPVG
ncbi:NAD-dependent epimerase/dehydratase family protein [Catenuloplanes atrovinosus]|uniref:Nucleoside-diphosphate-sugar epimerase n=1 Tax=Catenuloplanes atrovinosus TaxID=137266 RepID=A0AAE4C8L4_9ACTN|nr:NAD(P)-dependent oxidoreductase [Catenuloplanes atrovinosus]MDR7273914.1 nucleoside-diphosphate-sugar epimerase [Catenuloplanes atrovinosus]